MRCSAWYKGDQKPSFALDERLDGKMANLFQDKGVPKEQIKVLPDQKATVRNVQGEFVRFMLASKPGELLIAYLNCCFSGGRVELVKKRNTGIAYGCLSSTFSQQLGWSGWRFARCLMRGFEGNPVVDRDGDGRIELEELADCSAHYMAFAADPMSQRSQRPVPAKPSLAPPISATAQPFAPSFNRQSAIA